MVNYYFNDQKQFVIENYDAAKPFASFLPGIAGVDGIPMWVYYVNRGQAISSFGIENKDNPILDFTPANLSYRRTEIDGFRTFLKIDGVMHECFKSTDSTVKKTMKIEANALEIEEYDPKTQLTVTIRYFNVTGDDYPGLIRKATIRNHSKQARSIEWVDGLATMWPFGTTNWVVKFMSNLAVAWFDVFFSEQHLPFMRNRSTTEDTAIVGTVESGHFYGSFSKDGIALPIIFDLNVLFGENTALLDAVRFRDRSLSLLLKEPQVSVNKLLGAFSAYDGIIEEELTFYTVIGKMVDIATLNKKARSFDVAYFSAMETKAKELGDRLTTAVSGKTNHPIFDAYIRQSFLDNLLRGGYPILFQGENGPIVYHVFSRIHGDMEREYNNFFVEPAFYSHGNGSYRDVNQNRRNDVYFVKEAGLFNIKQFLDLIQIDGQNPLTIKGSTLVCNEKHIEELMALVVDQKETIKMILQSRFTPGKLLTTIRDNKIRLAVQPDDFLKSVIAHSKQEIEAAFGTGYWSDHWTYNMDLIDNYLNVFPDKRSELMFNGKYRFFQSPMTVLKRDQKTVRMKDGKIRQLEPVIQDHIKIQTCQLNPSGTNWHRNDQGTIIEVDLFTKLFHLGLMKFVTLDPFGMGIMMDADKPGWNDSMNGLPGIFGSGLPETVELKRLLVFLIQIAEDFSSQETTIPRDIKQLFDEILSILKTEPVHPEKRYDSIQDAREVFRDKTNLFIPFEWENVRMETLVPNLKALLDVVDDGIERAMELGKGILPTYLTYAAEEVEPLDTVHPHLKLENVHVKSWSVRMLPYYLEAPARYLKQCPCPTDAMAMHRLIKQSEMYDRTLRLYITSTSLEDETLEIGRARAFTKGWLEREACFMHMSYKYLIGLLKSGLYKEYFSDMKTSLPPFMDPALYGRSLLENSSFIATSNNPNPNNHGRGFVSRLTGTTSEALTMYLTMMTGKHLFQMNEGELCFSIHPILTEDFFDEDNRVLFRLFDQIDVELFNPERLDTFGRFGAKTSSYVLIDTEGEKTTVYGAMVKGNSAHRIREGHIKKIFVTLTKEEHHG